MTSTLVDISYGMQAPHVALSMPACMQCFARIMYAPHLLPFLVRRHFYPLLIKVELWAIFSLRQALIKVWLVNKHMQLCPRERPRFPDVPLALVLGDLDLGLA